MSLLAPIRRHRADQTARSGVLRSVRLFRLFLAEQSDPEAFYTGLAEDAVRQVAEHGTLAGRTVVDVGGGGGWFTAAFRARGAHCYLFEPDPAELYLRTAAPAGAVVADGYWLPVRDGGADVTFSSNVLEHVSDPMGLIEEMIRVTRPGGLVYLSFCNWYSPWGGHEMSPWHYLGSGYAARRYAAAASAPAQARVRRQPVPGAHRAGAPGGAGPAGRHDRGRAAPVLPALVRLPGPGAWPA